MGGTRRPWRPRWLRFFAVVAACLATAGTAQAATSLRTIIEDVPAADGFRYAARDDFGNSLDGLKIVKAAWGGYLGVYQAPSGTGSVVKVATSIDLLHWSFEANLATNASQPYIYKQAGSGSLVAYESAAGCGGAGTCLAVRYYDSESGLLHGAASRSVVLPRKLSTCAEGTPSISSATSDLSSISIGFHYLKNCSVERQARGTLRAFGPTSWSPSTATSLDNAIIAAGAASDGNIGDRDGAFYDGAFQRLHEGEVADVTSRVPRNFLLTGDVGSQLTITTHGGSRSFAHPTFTPLRLPSGELGIVVTELLDKGSAAAGEGGELIYYRQQTPKTEPPDPTIAAAGDISCTTQTCRDDETSKLMLADPPTKVLTLGDNQYESGEIEKFWGIYALDWGRLKSITMPSPGNHDPPSSGYGAYFDKPANYSYDLGDWHLISLDSTNVTGAAAFLDADLAQNPRRCILAYWHHPRFSSGATHGNNSAMGALWTRLEAAGADVVLNGHSHDYERFAQQTAAAVASPTGIREFVVGTGGRALHSIGTVAANSDVRIGGRFGVLFMTLHPASYDWSFRADDGTTLDSGSDDCS